MGAPHGLTRKAARALIKSEDGRSWRVEKLKHARGEPELLLPIKENGAPQTSGAPETPRHSSIFDGSASAAAVEQAGTNHAPLKPAPGVDYSAEAFAPTAEREPGEEG